MRILLFTHEPDYARAAIAAGVSQLVVDWERAGKARRQRGWDTEINHGTPGDLAAAVAVAPGRVVCRVNNTAQARDRECRLAVELGASEVWLPMMRSPREAEHCLRVLDGEARLGVMVETREAMRMPRELAALPLARVYVGLHDYRIDNGHAGLFDPLVDGTIDRFREQWTGDFGVAGITEPGGGAPVPQSLLLAAMARLRCGFGVARRCFRGEVPPGRLAQALANIDARHAALLARTPLEEEEDFRQLAGLLAGLAREAEAEGLCAL